MATRPCNDCPECTCIERSSCVTDSVTIDGLLFDTDYLTRWTNQRTQAFIELQGTSDGSGLLTILLTDLPQGLFNEFDEVRVELFDDNSEPVIIPGTITNCVLLRPKIREEITNLVI